MKPSKVIVKLILAAALFLIIIVLISSCYGTHKTVLFQNKVHHWKVYFVKRRHLSIGTYRHFEVYYKDQKVKLPKEITDGRHEISEFVSATAIDNRSSQFGTVIVTFEGDFTNEEGVPYRAFITLHITPDKENDLLVTNPCNGSKAIITLTQN